MIAKSRSHLLQRHWAFGVDLWRRFRFSNGYDGAAPPLAGYQNSGEAIDLAAGAVVTKYEPVRVRRAPRATFVQLDSTPLVGPVPNEKDVAVSAYRLPDVTVGNCRLLVGDAGEASHGR